MNEKFHKGAIKINPIHRWINQHFFRKQHKNYGRGIVDWTKPPAQAIPPCENQGNNDSCGGQAASGAIFIERGLRGVREGKLSAKSYYAPIAYKGGGTTVPRLITQICARGGNSESTVSSYDLYGNALNEQMMEDMSWQTPALIKDALTRAGYTPMNVKIDVESIASAIASNGWCIMEIQGQNGNQPDWRSIMPSVPNKNNPNEIWNHFMVLWDYKIYNLEKVIVAMQSMGTSYGINGVQYFGADYFSSGYVLDVFTAVHDDLLIPAGDPQNYSAWQAVCAWFRSLWGLPVQTSPSPS